MPFSICVIYYYRTMITVCFWKLKLTRRRYHLVCWRSLNLLKASITVFQINYRETWKNHTRVSIFAHHLCLHPTSCLVLTNLFRLEIQICLKTKQNNQTVSKTFPLYLFKKTPFRFPLALVRLLYTLVMWDLSARQSHFQKGKLIYLFNRITFPEQSNFIFV